MTDETPDVVSRARAALDERDTPTRTGHGHVRPLIDGSRARCGGPRLCKVCQQEALRTPDAWGLVRDLLAEVEHYRDGVVPNLLLGNENALGERDNALADRNEARAEVERLTEANAELVKRGLGAAEARDEARAAVDRAWMLHSKRPVAPGCTTCNEPWPCSTIRTLDKEA